MEKKPYDKEYFVFFTKVINDYANKNNSAVNNYENFTKGLADVKICSVCKIRPGVLNQFIDNAKSMYEFIECVGTHNSKKTIDEINTLLNISLESEKTEFEKLQDQMKEFKLENKKLREELETKKVIDKPIKKHSNKK